MPDVHLYRVLYFPTIQNRHCNLFSPCTVNLPKFILKYIDIYSQIIKMCIHVDTTGTPQVFLLDFLNEYWYIPVLTLHVVVYKC